jgi:hypothetical protein
VLAMGQMNSRQDVAIIVALLMLCDEHVNLELRTAPGGPAMSSKTGHTTRVNRWHAYR